MLYSLYGDFFFGRIRGSNLSLGVDLYLGWHFRTGFLPPGSLLNMSEFLNGCRLARKGRPLEARRTFEELRHGLGVKGLILPILFESGLPLNVL